MPGCPEDAPCFTRADGTQFGVASDCTRIHASQINPYWALRVDGHPEPTAQCVPVEPRVAPDLILTDKTAADIALDPMAIAAQILSARTAVILPANQPTAADGTRLELRQVMLIMNPLASGPIICSEK